MNETINIKEIFKDYEIAQNNPHHFGSVIEHTKAVCDYISGFDSLSEEIRVAAIFHDMGKKDCKDINPKTGFDTFYHHADRSTEIFNEKFARDYPDLDTKYIADLIRYHDYSANKEGKIKTLLEDKPNSFAADLIFLKTADIMGQTEYQRVENCSRLMILLVV